MANLSLTDFVDVASRVGSSKTVKLSQIKNRPPYHPAFDYYKALREHLIFIHQSGRDRNDIYIPEKITDDSKKWVNYSLIIEGYKLFLGRKVIKWFEPPHSEWTFNDVTVTLNPELGLLINGKPFVIKLYMKADKLSKAKVDISLFLMHQILPQKYEEQAITYSILDVREHHLYTPTAFPSNILYTLIAETAFINSIWPNL